MQPTSLVAYKAVKADGTAHRQQIQILEALAKAPGNAFQISTRIPLDKHSIGRRMSELLKDELIADTGNVAPTDSGRPSIVYAITAAGRSAISLAGQPAQDVAPLNPYEQLKELVRQMRETQKGFYAARRAGKNASMCKAILEKSKALEREVDALIAPANPQNVQPNLPF